MMHLAMFRAGERTLWRSTIALNKYSFWVFLINHKRSCLSSNTQSRQACDGTILLLEFRIAHDRWRYTIRLPFISSLPSLSLSFAVLLFLSLFFLSIYCTAALAGQFKTMPCNALMTSCRINADSEKRKDHFYLQFCIISTLVWSWDLLSISVCAHSMYILWCAQWLRRRGWMVYSPFHYAY